MAVGAAVVLCDARGSGPLVTAAELDRLRPLNFGLRALSSPLDLDALAGEIARYDPEDAARVSARIRREAALDGAIDQLLAVYREALAEPADASPASLAAEGRAAAAYLARLDPYLKERGRLLVDRDALWRRVARLTEEAARAANERDEAAALAARLRAELDALRATAAFRLRERLLARPALARLYRRLRSAIS